MAAAAAVGLRPIEAGDRGYLLGLLADLRRQDLDALGLTDEAAAAFVTQQFDAQDRAYREYPATSFDLVVVDGRPAGRLIVSRWEDQLRIVDIALDAAHRGRGIGTALLEPVIAEGDANGLPVSIYVERFNPAQRLYARLGFELVEELPDGIYLLLARKPASDQAKTAS